MSILIYFATIFWSLFPNLIHVFQGGENIINKVNEQNLVINGDFSDGSTGYGLFGSPYLTFNNNTLVMKKDIGVSVSDVGIYQDVLANVDDKIYYSIQKKGLTNGAFLTLRYSNYQSNSNFISVYNLFIDGIEQNTFNISSGIFTNQKNNFRLQLFTYVTSVSSINVELDYIYMFNVSQMINKGVKNDLGISFSDLTNEQIISQLDTWIIEYGDLSFTITKDNTYDSWFNSGFVDKQAERDFLDYLGYFLWLTTPPIILFITLDTLRRLL